jgi:hypothetical protein
MTIALELGKSEDEVAHWELKQVARWAAFFKLKGEWQDKERNKPAVSSNTTVIYD